MTAGCGRLRTKATGRAARIGSQSRAGSRIGRPRCGARQALPFANAMAFRSHISRRLPRGGVIAHGMVRALGRLQRPQEALMSEPEPTINLRVLVVANKSWECEPLVN